MIGSSRAARRAGYTPKITANDVAGKQHSLQFTWTINAAVTGAIKGDHGKCLDDSGSGTANGTL